MNFTPSPSLDRTRREFRAWLESNLPDHKEWQRLRNDGESANRVAFLKAWQRRLHDSRWIAVHWPAAYGGRDLSLLDHLVVSEEMLRADAPPLINGHSVSISGPTLLTFGTPEQKARYLPKLLSADEIWCLGFSEPNAGSDLGSLRTRAERDGDDFVVSGQKVWTTYANDSEFGLFLVRTDPSVPNHQGISCLIVSLRSPGVTIRPLRELTGDKDFNEVFLEQVRVPVQNLVGEINRGWQVILAALGHERGTLLLLDRVRLRRRIERLLAMARQSPAFDESDGRLRQQIAQSYVEVEILRLHCLKAMSELEQRRPPADVSILKLFGSELTQRLDEFALALQGPYAQIWRGTRAVGDGEWQDDWLMARAATIASGTSEIQRNTIAQRLLGLPRGGTS
jgi:alkylation response protein AidB-like acyl-CoA dehydrogenase